MKTHKNLSKDELRILQSKTAIAFNKRILDDTFMHIFSKVNEIEKLITIYDALEAFISSLDPTITTTSKPLNLYETNS